MNTPYGAHWKAWRKTLAKSGADEADLARFDRILSRRRFLVRTSGGALALGLFGAGFPATTHGLFGRGLLPRSWDDIRDDDLPKPGMIVHSEDPFNGEFPPHLLDDRVTPTPRHFVRNNGRIPEEAQAADARGWTLRIEGRVQRERTLSMEDLLRFPSVTMNMVLECAGNGRRFFTPEAKGTSWIRGAVACSEWTGVRLRDVLEDTGVQEDAVYIGCHGKDAPVGDGEPFSRGIPIEKALDEHTLLAFRMNGGALPAAHGFPLRLLVPGWIGSSMQKWLDRIEVKNTVHDSEKMSGYSYRVPAWPVAPGATPPEENMVIATSLSVKSLVTHPEAGRDIRAGDAIEVRGHAWAGEHEVTQVLVSTDFGIRWQEARLTPPSNRYAWSHWETDLVFENRGYYEIWARAFDDAGRAQPFRQPWNPNGYLGNVIHRVPVQVSP